LNQTPKNHDVRVNLGQRSYAIRIEPGVLDELAKVVASVVSEKHVVVVTDSNVGPIYLQPAVEQLQAVATRVDHITVDAGEKSKCVSVCDELWQRIDETSCKSQPVSWRKSIAVLAAKSESICRTQKTWSVLSGNPSKL